MERSELMVLMKSLEEQRRNEQYELKKYMIRYYNSVRTYHDFTRANIREYSKIDLLALDQIEKLIFETEDSLKI